LPDAHSREHVQERRELDIELGVRLEDVEHAESFFDHIGTVSAEQAS
jgi:hypothetical protein